VKGCGSVAFFVAGKPVTQGSKWSPKGSHAVIDQSGEKLTSWRELIGWEAKAAWSSGTVKGRVCVHLHFKMSRPNGHYGTGRNASMVKESSPQYHTQVPDIDKLTRAILDALTGVVFRDDSQVQEIHVTKKWTEGDQGVLIMIETDPKGENDNEGVHAD